MGFTPHGLVIQLQNKMTAVRLRCRPNQIIIRIRALSGDPHRPLVTKQQSAIIRLDPYGNQPCNDTLLSVCSPRVHHVHNKITGARTWLTCDGSSSMGGWYTVTQFAVTQGQMHGPRSVQQYSSQRQKDLASGSMRILLHQSIDSVVLLLF